VHQVGFSLYDYIKMHGEQNIKDPMELRKCFRFDNF